MKYSMHVFDEQIEITFMFFGWLAQLSIKVETKEEKQAF